ncbi:MAG: hypothetical protein LBU32_14105 [Clostridiales bacterium]|nr:hypothetical protein [Clostridiales bacterium]
MKTQMMYSKKHFSTTVIINVARNNVITNETEEFASGNLEEYNYDSSEPFKPDDNKLSPGATEPIEIPSTSKATSIDDPPSLKAILGSDDRYTAFHQMFLFWSLTIH